jgi:hypothetical protein
MTAWSFSRLNSYEQCPKKYFRISVQKDIKEPASEVLAYGDEVHAALKDRVAKGKDLPLHLSHLEPLASVFSNPKPKPLDIVTEQQLAITKDFKPTGWFDKDVWCRAIIDYCALYPVSALIVDYKTGRQSEDFTQLKLCAGMLMLHRPKIESVKLVYWWVKDKVATSDYVHRDDMPEVWSEIMERVKRYDAAHEETNFPARQNFLCKKHCPVKDCGFNGS